MGHVCRLAVAAAALAGLGGACGPRLHYDLTLPAQRATLANGIQVIAMPDRTTDLVAVVVRYRVGSELDPPRAAGLAHLVEHLTFQLRPGATSIMTEARERTVFVNAFTEAESTRYVALAHPSQLDALLRLEAARLTTPCSSIAPATFARERAVVGEELRERATPADVMRTQVLASVFGEDHPLAASYATEEAALGGLTLEAACRFIADHYVARRATVVLAGNLPADALARATRWLAPVPDRAPASIAQHPRHVTTPAFEELSLRGAGAAVFAFWSVPVELPEEILPFVLAHIETTPAFTRAMRRAIAGGARVLRLGRQRTIVASIFLPDAETLPVAQDAFNLANQRIFVTPGLDFERLRYALLTRAYLQWQGLIPRAEAVAELAADATREPLGTTIRALRDLDAATVNDGIGRVLKRANMGLRVVTTERGDGEPLATLEPPAARPIIDERGDEPSGALDPPVPAIASPLGDAVVADILENGLRVVLLPRPSPFPVVSVRLVLPVGTAHALPGQDLVPSATAALVTPQPRRYDIPGGFILGHPWYIAGARHDVMVTADATIASADGLSDSLPQLLEGLDDWVSGDVAEGDDYIDSAVAFVLRNLPTYADRMTLEALQEAVYGPSHPYARRSVPRPNMVGQLEPEPLRAWQRRHYHATGATLVVAGSFEPRAAETLVRRIFSGWRAGIKPPIINRPAAPKEAPAFIGLAAPTRTVDVTVAFPAAPATDDRRAAARLILNEVLGREAGALRDKLGASYTVRADLVSRTGPGMEVVHADVALERAQESIDALRDRLHGPAQRDAIARVFEAGRRAALAKLAVEIDDCAALADALAALADQPERAERMLAVLATVTVDEVVALAREEIVAGREVVLVRGPRAVLEKLRVDRRAPRFVDVAE